MFEEILQSLRFEFITGDVSVVEYNVIPERYIWRQLPCWVIGYARTDTPDSFFVEIPPHGSFVVNDKSLGIVPANQLHKYTATAGHRNISTWFQCKYTFDHGIDLSEFVDFPPMVHPPTSCIVKDLIEELLRVHADGTFSPLRKKINQCRLGFEILHSIMPFAKEHRLDELSHHDATRIFPVLDYISRKFAEDIDVQFLAEMAHLSPTHFNKVFQQVLKLSPMQFVRRTRMSKACEILSSTTLSVGEIARRVGYEDQYIFSRAFKKVMGSSPRHYRKHGEALTGIR